MREAIRARYHELLAEAKDPDQEERAKLYARAQKALRQERGVPLDIRRKEFRSRDPIRCCCYYDSSIWSVLTYDDWGDGPQCVLCGEIKKSQ